MNRARIQRNDYRVENTIQQPTRITVHLTHYDSGDVRASGILCATPLSDRIFFLTGTRVRVEPGGRGMNGTGRPLPTGQKLGLTGTRGSYASVAVGTSDPIH